MEQEKPQKEQAPNTARPPGDWQVPNPDEYPDPNAPETTKKSGEGQG